MIFYTSGTTGEPKGAVLTHLNLVMNATVNVFDANDARPADVVLGCLPLFHTFGQTVGMNGTFRLGATLVLLARFTGEAALELMERSRSTSSTACRRCISGCCRPPRTGTGCRSCGSASPAGRRCRWRCWSASTPPSAPPSSRGTACRRPHRRPPPTSRTSACGRARVGHSVWGVEVEVARAEIDERIELLPAGELGELVVRGHNVFAGYLGRPRETAQAAGRRLVPHRRPRRQGRRRASSRIVDRKKDVVIRGGFNVYPREVEEVLARHPGVGQVAVIGVPDPVHGEEVCAVVVARDGEPAPTADGLVDWCRERLGRHKYPRQVRFVTQLPVGPSHKVLKRELRRTIEQL